MSFAAWLIADTTALAQDPSLHGGPGSIHKDGSSSGGTRGNHSLLGPGGGPYHNGDTLYCNDCHVMHLSMQHNYQGGTGPEAGVPAFPAIFADSKKLLKGQDPLDVCLACHDGQVGVPDVVGLDVNGLSERSAGHFADPEILNPRGHDLGRNLPPSPDDYCVRCHFGGPGNEKVTCIDCHNPHGNGNARNLQWASWPEGTPPLGLLNPPGASFPAKYERSSVAYGTANSYALREVTNMCLDCHHVFTGAYYNDPDGNGIHSRHPSYDSERGDPDSISQGAVRGSTNPAHWLAGSGPGFDTTIRVPFVTSGAASFATASQVDSTINGVFCLSCHKAHGSSSAFSLVWRTTGPVNAVGCDQCHGKTLPD